LRGQLRKNVVFGDRRFAKPVTLTNSQSKAREKNKEMLREYDFSQGVRGKYARRYARGSNVVVLEPDVAKVFPNAKAVNSSLRSLAEIIGRRKSLSAK